MTLANRYSHTDARTIIAEGLADYEFELEDYESEQKDYESEQNQKKLLKRIERLNPTELWGVTVTYPIRYGVWAGIVALYSDERTATMAAAALNGSFGTDDDESWDEYSAPYYSTVKIGCDIDPFSLCNTISGEMEPPTPSYAVSYIE